MPVAGLILRARVWPSIGAENPIPKEINHREIAVRMPMMNKVQFLLASEPGKLLKPRPRHVALDFLPVVNSLARRLRCFLKHDVAYAFPSLISIAPCSRCPGRDAPAHRAGAATRHPGHRLRAVLCHSAGRDEGMSAGVERRDDCLYALAVIPCRGLNSSRRCSRTQATPSSRSATPRRAVGMATGA
jgi:hypothetical protein